MIRFIHIPKNAGHTIKRCINNIPDISYVGHLSTNNVLIPRDIYSESKTIVVLRDPITRFQSGVQYGVQAYNRKPISTNEFINALTDPRHPERTYISKEISNKIHHIGGRLLEFKQTYAPQHHWVNNPTYVILMENLESEFNILLKHLGHQQVSLPKINRRRPVPGGDKLSTKSLEYLCSVYGKDFALLNKYNNMSVEDRLHLT